MKTLPLLLSLAVAGVSNTAHAELFIPSNVARGAALGAVAGAFVGGHNHDRWGEGALIGGAVGALIGVVTQPERNGGYYERPAVTRVIGNAPVVYEAPTVAYVPAYEPGVTYVESQPVRVVYVERPAPVRVVQIVERPRVVYVRPNYGYGHGQRPREVVYYNAPRDCDRGW